MCMCHLMLLFMCCVLLCFVWWLLFCIFGNDDDDDEESWWCVLYFFSFFRWSILLDAPDSFQGDFFLSFRRIFYEVYSEDEKERIENEIGRRRLNRNVFLWVFLKKNKTTKNDDYDDDHHIKTNKNQKRKPKKTNE